MDAQDAPSSSEWRPQSSLSGGVPSTAPSSTLLVPPTSPHADRSSTSSGSHIGLAGMSTTEMQSQRRDLAPWEPVACATLIEQIRYFSSVHTPRVPPEHPPPHLESLAGALTDAAVTIQFNAKWFAERDLAELLAIALSAAAASTSSADFYAAVKFVDVVATYSLLPPLALSHVARFFSQTYYNATRANKTKKLADAVWSSTERLLKSHLGRQYVAALIHLIDANGSAAQDFKVGYARLAGALMVLFQKLLVWEEARLDLLEYQMTALSERMQHAASHGDAHVRQLIAETITTLFSNQNATQAISAQSSWTALLAAAETCLSAMPRMTCAKELIRCLIANVDHFDDSERNRIAELGLEAEQPLTGTLRGALPTRWSKLLPVRDWDSTLEKLIRRFAASDEYIPELETLIARGIAVFDNSPDRYRLAEYARHLRACMEDPNTTDNAVAVLGQNIVKIFKHCTITGSVPSELNDVFDTLCAVAKRSLDVIEFLMLIRADIEGNVLFSIHQIPYSIPSVPLGSLDTAILGVIHGNSEWKIYHHVISQLSLFLSNQSQFGEERLGFIKQLRQELVRQMDTGSFPNPPTETGLIKSHVGAQLIEILTTILSYHRHLSKQEIVSTISLILTTAGSRDYIVSVPCVHALTICCYEAPDLMSSYMDEIIDRMSKMVTQRHLAIHVLLFLAGLSRLPDLLRNFRAHDYKKIFGVCGSYLQSIRGSSALIDRQNTPSDDRSSKASATEATDPLAQYVYALAHHVIAFWYLAIKHEHRRELKDYITSCLIFTDESGSDKIEDQGLVTIDLMDRVDADDISGAEDEEEEAFDTSDGSTITNHRLAGLLLISTETALRTGKSIVTVRRSSGTAKRIIKKGHRHPDGLTDNAVVAMDSGQLDWIPVVPDDAEGRTYGRIYIPPSTSPLSIDTIKSLPAENEAIERAIQAIDRTPALDSHKAGVIYIGEDQKKEEIILQNVQGSPDYVEFVEQLGTLRRLKNATFDTKGLDRLNDEDGPHVVVWNNEVTELVYHTTTLMPNNADIQLNTGNKKRHIGNDYINIVFNNSGAPFEFDTFPSAFASVYIVISPSARTSFLQTRRTRHSSLATSFYRVHVLTRPGYPALSSAASEKIVSGASLAAYVRNLALNDCVFSLMWSGHEGEVGEYPSSWRHRLDQIRRLGERFAV